MTADATPSVEKAADEIRFKAALKQRLLPEEHPVFLALGAGPPGYLLWRRTSKVRA